MTIFCSIISHHDGNLYKRRGNADNQEQQLILTVDSYPKDEKEKINSKFFQFWIHVAQNTKLKQSTYM